MKFKKRWIQPNQFLFRVAFILIVLSMFAAVFPQPVQAVACSYKHKVVAGDTLAYLGFIYQIDWLKIATANKLTTPYVLQIGQILCIPEGASAPSITGTTSTSSSTEPVIAAQMGYGYVVVGVERFPKQKNYYINAIYGTQMLHYRLGKLKTNKTGSATIDYKLPNFLMEKPDLIICAKDVMTDATLCTYVTNPYNLSYSAFFHCIKDGR